MAWFSSNKTGTKIQYHNPPLSEKELDIARLNTVYHIIKSMPYLVSEASLPHYRMRKLRYTFMVVIFGLLLLYYGLVIKSAILKLQPAMVIRSSPSMRVIGQF